MAIRKMNVQSQAIARLMATAADDVDTEDEDNKLTDDDQILALKEGVAAALEQNKAFSQALRGALDEFDAHWIDKKDLTTEGVLMIKKNPEASSEEVATQLTATVACFLKYLEVPEGTEDNVQRPEEEGEGDEEGDTESEDKPEADKKPAKKEE